MNKIERQMARDKKLEDMYKMVEKILEIVNGGESERKKGEKAPATAKRKS